MMPSGRALITAARSVIASGKSRGLMRTQSWVAPRPGEFVRYALTLSRATGFCEGATESSKSRMSTSAFTPALLASLRSLSPGTNNSERSLIALAFSASVRIACSLRPAVADLANLGLHVHGIAVKQGLGKPHHIPAEIGHGRAQGRVADGNSDHQAQCE